MKKLMIFIDYWNFQLSWNHYWKNTRGAAPGAVRIDWDKLPAVLTKEMPGVLGVSQEEKCEYKGVRIYASVNPESEKDRKLGEFLRGALAQKAGYRIDVKTRKSKTDTCRHCGRQTPRTVEKGVDTSIAVNLITAALDNLYDAAFLLSADADHIPAVQLIQDRLGKEVIFAGFRSGSDNIRKACWSHLLMDGAVADSIRT